METDLLAHTNYKAVEDLKTSVKIERFFRSQLDQSKLRQEKDNTTQKGSAKEVTVAL